MAESEAISYLGGQWFVPGMNAWPSRATRTRTIARAVLIAGSWERSGWEPENGYNRSTLSQFATHSDSGGGVELVTCVQFVARHVDKSTAYVDLGTSVRKAGRSGHYAS